MYRRTSSEYAPSRLTERPQSVAASARYGPNSGAYAPDGPKWLYTTSSTTPRPRRWQASTNRLSPSGPPYGSCGEYQQTPSYPQLCSPLNALTGNSSTRAMPRATRGARRPIAASKGPSGG